MFLAFDLSFFHFSITDAVDILVVGILIFQIYKLLRGSVAFNIFIGVVLLYVAWWLVRALNMELLALILGQFVNVGVIIIAIIFQPELRRFLLYLGNSTLSGQFNFLKRITETTNYKDLEINDLYEALLEFSQTKTGALIVLASESTMLNFIKTGVTLEARLKKNLLLSIFNKESPLHDGAVVIRGKRIYAASCVLPLSENPNLMQDIGLRHRAALGVSETANVAAFIVSEESGDISFTYQGKLQLDLEPKTVKFLIEKYLDS